MDPSLNGCDLWTKETAVNIDALTWDYSDSYQWMLRCKEGFGPVIISCALSGGIQGKEANAALPETPKEIAAQAAEAYNAGAAVVHIHGRDPNNLAQAA